MNTWGAGAGDMVGACHDVPLQNAVFLPRSGEGLAFAREDRGQLAARSAPADAGDATAQTVHKRG